MIIPRLVVKIVLMWTSPVIIRVIILGLVMQVILIAILKAVFIAFFKHDLFNSCCKVDSTIDNSQVSYEDCTDVVSPVIILGLVIKIDLIVILKAGFYCLF